MRYVVHAGGKTIGYKVTSSQGPAERWSESSANELVERGLNRWRRVAAVRDHGYHRVVGCDLGQGFGD